MVGIRQLLATMKDHELAVLFRNNHFSTLMKHNVSFSLVYYPKAPYNQCRSRSSRIQILNQLSFQRKYISSNLLIDRGIISRRPENPNGTPYLE